MRKMAAIMAGGQGTRFWPESTRSKPKQYLTLIGKESLLEQTMVRFDGLVSASDQFVITVQDQMELVKENSTQGFLAENIVLEPAGRNTAPCILLGLVQVLNSGANEDDLIAIVPADHVILNTKAYQDTLNTAFDYAASEAKIVTIGIPPNFPHTGYGYIKKGASQTDGISEVERFVEKPNFETAKTYLASGDYLWNAGMFVARIGTLLNELEKCSPEIYKYRSELKEALGNEVKLKEVYEKIPSDSIDYAVMEKSENVAVVPASFDWNDLGSWDALEAVVESTNENTVVATKDNFISEAKGNIIFAPNQFTSVVGVNDLIIVSNEKSLMVLPKDQSQKVKDIVGHLKDNDNLKDLL